MNAIDLISRAMRRIGVLASGQLPQDDELEDAIETLRGLLLRMVSEGTFGELQDTIADSDTHVATASRILRNNADTIAITLPETVEDARTCALRSPYHGTVVVISDQFTGETVTYLYDGDVAKWLAIETIDQTSEVPMAHRDPSGFTALLAVELADEFGMEISEPTAFAAMRYQSSLAHDWSRSFPTKPRPENYF